MVDEDGLVDVDGEPTIDRAAEVDGAVVEGGAAEEDGATEEDSAAEEDGASGGVAVGSPPRRFSSRSQVSVFFWSSACSSLHRLSSITA